jgi:hypothetical protein
MRHLTRKAIKKIILNIASLILVCCGGVYLQNKLNSDVYLKQYNFITEKFKEPIEKILFIFPNLDVFEVTTHDEDKIDISCDILLWDLQKNQIHIENVIMIIHNHLNPIPFTEGDINCYRFFKSHGFQGAFALYIQNTDKIIFIKDK